MNSIKQFNQLLNSDKFDRFKQWKTYRNQLTNFIVDNYENFHDEALILGTGNSDDLDLNSLSKLVSILTISDIDKESLEKAFIKYDLNEKYVLKKAFDYTGLDSNIDWNNFVENILKFQEESAIDYYFNKLNKAISTYQFPLRRKYDLIIISSLYTQLIFQQGLSNINILHNLNYPKELLKHIEVKLLELIPIVLNKFNENILTTLKKPSTLIVLSDIFEAYNHSLFFKETSGLENIEKIYQEYQDKYGIGIGDYGLINMSEKLKIHKSKWFEWPFNEDKTLFVKAIIFKN